MSSRISDWTQETGSEDEREASGRPRATNKARTRFNDRLVWALLAVVFLSAIPLGSNRPLFWALWASVLGLISAIYLILIRSRRAALFCPLDRIRFLLVPFLAVAAFVAFQMAPTGAALAIVGLGSGEVGPYGASHFSLTPGDSWLALCRWLSYGLLFFLTIQLTARSRRRKLLSKGLFAIVAIQALYSLAALTQFGDTILFFDKWAYEGFATGTFVNRNSLATYLALGLVIGATNLFSGNEAGSRTRSSSRRRRASGTELGERIFWAAGCLAILAALLSTQSRMGLAAAFAGVATALFLSGRTISRRFLTLVILSAIAVVAYFGFGFDRYLLVERSAAARMELYKQVFGMIVQRPLTGFGAGSFEYAYPLFHTAPVSTDFVWERAHSTYLQLWSELGLVAGSVPLFMIVSLAAVVMRGSRMKGGPKPEQIVLAGAVACIATHSLVDFSLEMEAVAFLFVAILGIGSGELLGKSPAKDEAASPAP